MKEKQRRDNLPINKYVPDDQPDRDQLSFHSSTARFRLVFGGNRSGKSVCSAYEIVAEARGHSKYRKVKPGPKEIYVISAEYRTLYMGIHNHLAHNRSGMKFLPKDWVHETGPKFPGANVPLPSYYKIYCTHNSDGTPVDPNMPLKDRPVSTVWFISGDGGEQARQKVQAASLDMVVIDEEVGDELYNELKLRILDKNGIMVVSCTLIRSEEWLLALEERAENKDPSVHVSRLSTETSQHISDDAKREIFDAMSDEEKQVRVFGKSRRAFGLVYPTFKPDSHIYVPGQDTPWLMPPLHWPRFRANDPGYKIHAVLWAALDPETYTLYFYRELYGKELYLSDVCKDIAYLEGYDLIEDGMVYRKEQRQNAEIVQTCLIDPAAARTLEDGSLSIAAQMASKFSLPTQPAQNDVHSGIEATRRLLQTNSRTNKPFIQISAELKNFLSEIRRYRLRGDTSSRNTHATRIEPLKKRDHLMDCFRYICFWHSLVNRPTVRKETNEIEPIKTNGYNKRATSTWLGDDW